MRVQIDEPGQDEEPGRVEHLRAVGGEPLPHLGHRTLPQDDVEETVAAGGRIDESAPADEESAHMPSRSPSHGRPVRSR